jgi:alkylation response protein AidB-like acyl-CoA dehydrogenase
VATLRIDATVPQGNRVIGPNEASAVLAAARDWALVAASAELLGLIRGALGMTIDYMKTRKQFGRAIGSFQALQHRVVNLHLQQELVSACVADAAEEIATTSDPVARVRAASRAKARASDAALLVTREAIQLHGGIGFTEEHDIGLYLKRALVLSAWLGNGATHVRRYAELDR